MEKVQKVSDFRRDTELSELYRTRDMIQPTTVSNGSCGYWQNSCSASKQEQNVQIYPEHLLLLRQ